MRSSVEALTQIAQKKGMISNAILTFQRPFFQSLYSRSAH